MITEYEAESGSWAGEWLDMLLARRQALLVELGAIERLLIAYGRITKRTVTPKHERD